MPVWRIFSNPSTFTAAQRAGLAKAVTDLYVSRGLPAFYVNVLFINLEEEDVWVGGEKRTNFVRIIVEQIARTMARPDTEEGKKFRTGWMDRINEVRMSWILAVSYLVEMLWMLMLTASKQTLRPHILDRQEIDWELHIYETPRDLWRIQGLDPPPAFSEEEKMWVEKNRAVPYGK